GREHHVPRERRLYRDLGGLKIANLADQDDVGVLTQDRAERRGEGDDDVGVDRHLDDAVDVVLDRILAGDDLVSHFVQLIDGGIERGGLARSRRTGDEDDAIG